MPIVIAAFAISMPVVAYWLVVGIGLTQVVMISNKQKPIGDSSLQETERFTVQFDEPYASEPSGVKYEDSRDIIVPMELTFLASNVGWGTIVLEKFFADWSTLSGSAGRFVEFEPPIILEPGESKVHKQSYEIFLDLDAIGAAAEKKTLLQTLDGFVRIDMPVRVQVVFFNPRLKERNFDLTPDLEKRIVVVQLRPADIGMSSTEFKALPIDPDLILGTAK